MEIKKIAWLAFILGLFVITAGFLACAPAQAPERIPAKAKDDRGISMIQKLRTQAVSRRAGWWAVVINHIKPPRKAGCEPNRLCRSTVIISSARGPQRPRSGRRK